ncbi:type IX secretion system outer membrane channel protein PorV [Flavobacterium sp. MAH-1]|uniref:Type IX secretion system outer membrane channel protein PorV n=1 Tax=Flavobacterium agri TaxID=2743471 RepID=A0A7Y8Y2J9_9FLAO|nr:type IX secretion system outer membrane channel protein PorV [Flavobacterium agri]NUY80714.1 type IX secretion system outer membrane channel protein PorV [Flavobacterium agri]NYA70738.1 type IX secretion system outer membrane channel protein PorV [Flavobacterium agri]
MRKIAISLLCLFAIQISTAQIEETDRVITTGVPFLLIAADARSAGMADQGVATSPDAFSMQYNPAKFAFSLDKQGFSVNYTPYLTELVNDISLGQVTYFNRYSERSAFAGSLRYFSLGEIELRQNFDDPAQVVKPNELALDVAYALKLSERFSMSVAGRYIRSALKIPSENNDVKPASTFAFDISGYYQSEEIAYNDFNGRWRLGFNFQNLGPKIKYDISEDDTNANFLPANMRIGGGFDFILDEYNKVGVGLEFTKLLVPTPQIPDYAKFDANGDGEIDNTEATNAEIANNEEYRNINWVSGIFQSFGDAPDGFSEELKEVTYSVGAEYLYQDSFAFRLGYFNENKEKGARKFFSLGAGFRYNIVKIDVSYLFSASKVRNPLENTLRFSLSFNFGEKWEEN